MSEVGTSSLLENSADTEADERKELELVVSGSFVPCLAPRIDRASRWVC